jgi:hypothetical protein
MVEVCHSQDCSLLDTCAEVGLWHSEEKVRRRTRDSQSGSQIELKTIRASRMKTDA